VLREVLHLEGFFPMRVPWPETNADSGLTQTITNRRQKNQIIPKFH
jgi:hypothetical protein